MYFLPCKEWKIVGRYNLRGSYFVKSCDAIAEFDIFLHFRLKKILIVHTCT